MSLPRVVEEARALRKEGKFTEALSQLTPFLGQLTIRQRDERIATLNEQSQCLWRLGQYSEAETCAYEALQLADKEPLNCLGQGDALNNLGSIYFFRGKLDQAEKFFQKSLKFREQLSNPQDVAESLNSLGAIYWNRGALDKAEKYLQQSLTSKESLGNPRDIAVSLNNLGSVCLQRGELNRAQEFYERSIALREPLGNPRDIAVSLNNLGIVYFKCGKLDRAEKVFQRSLVLFEETGVPINIADSLLQLVRVLVAKNVLTKAKEKAKKLVHLARTSEIPEVELRHLLAVCLLKLTELDFPKALTSASQAKDLAIQIPHFELQVEAIQLLVQIHLQMYLLSTNPDLKAGHKATVETLLQDLEDHSKRERLHGSYAETILIQGLLKRAVFDLPGAIQQFKLAELLAEERGICSVAKKARYELKQLHEQTDVLQRFMDFSPEVYEHLQLKEMISYFQDAQKLVETKDSS